jgi:hypothetical protein
MKNWEGKAYIVYIEPTLAIDKSGRTMKSRVSIGLGGQSIRGMLLGCG